MIAQLQQKARSLECIATCRISASQSRRNSRTYKREPKQGTVWNPFWFWLRNTTHSQIIQAIPSNYPFSVCLNRQHASEPGHYETGTNRTASSDDFLQPSLKNLQDHHNLSHPILISKLSPAPITMLRNKRAIFYSTSSGPASQPPRPPGGSSPTSEPRASDPGIASSIVTSPKPEMCRIMRPAVFPWLPPKISAHTSRG